MADQTPDNDTLDTTGLIEPEPAQDEAPVVTDEREPAAEGSEPARSEWTDHRAPQRPSSPEDLAAAQALRITSEHMEALTLQASRIVSAFAELFRGDYTDRRSTPVGAVIELNRTLEAAMMVISAHTTALNENSSQLKATRTFDREEVIPVLNANTRAMDDHAKQLSANTSALNEHTRQLSVSSEAMKNHHSPALAAAAEAMRGGRF